MAKYLLCIAVAFSLSCAPESPQFQAGAQEILNLQIIQTLGPSLKQNRPLYSPRSITVNQLGEIFIADYGNDRIVKLDSSFAFVEETGGFGAGESGLSGPISIALDKISNVYVIDSGNRRVVRFDRYLNFISADDGFDKDERISFIRPVSIGLSNQGDILVGDEGLGACYRLDQFFSYIYEFGSQNDIQPVNVPASIACGEDNKIYVADSDYGKIYIYDDHGLLIKTIGEDVLQKPMAVAVSKNSGIWVADEETGFIHCFNFRGEEIFRWNGFGGQNLVKPTGLFIDSDDLLYIVDSSTARVYITRPIVRK
jgi:tripartite motif-containing protein 71